MTDTAKIVIPAFDRTAIKAAMSEPRLAEGDYRFVMMREPKFFLGKKEGTEHVYAAMINWYPLNDPRDRNSVAKYISVSQRLVHPTAILTEEQAAMPADKRPYVSTRDKESTLSFFRALTGDETFNVNGRPRKGETKEQHAERYASALEKAAEMIQILIDSPATAVSGRDAWSVDGRVKHSASEGKVYVNVNFYSNVEFANPPWAYSKVKTVG